jgi:hypothetical protein
VVVALISPAIAQDRAYLTTPGSEQAGPLVATLRHEQRPGDLILVPPDAVPAFLYYWCRSTPCRGGLWAAGRHFVLWHSDPMQLLPGSILLGNRMASTQTWTARVRAVLSRRRRTWMLFTHTDPDTQGHLMAVAQQYGLVTVRQVAGGASLCRVDPSVRPHDNRV